MTKPQRWMHCGFTMFYSDLKVAQLKNPNSHKMAPRGEEENGAKFWLEHKTSCAIYVACVKDPIEEKLPQNSAYWMTNLL